MSREEQAFTVRDGRRVYAHLAGPRDGMPIVIHMGTPGSRHIWKGLVEAGAERGLRHICCSRPGYEGSDRQPGRSFADVAADIEDVADALGLDRFYIAGVSAGANFALACAALLPDRVPAAVAMAPLAPRNAAGLDWTAGMCRANIEEFEALEAGPPALEAFIGSQIPRVGEVKSEIDFVEELKDWVRPVDVAAFRECLYEAAVIESERLAGNGIWGWYDDDWAMWGEWGFDPAEIAVPVSIWHGEQDLLIPPSHGRWLAERIPGARAHLLPEVGHMSLWVRHYGSALDELLELGRK
jgi:pimeloyl-ACP methyl ester carboxylesterase